VREAISESPTAPQWHQPEIRRRRFSFIWALPIVALLAAAWLGYTAFSEKGPSIKITFRTATGLEAGKTRIKHHEVELGVVEKVDPSPDLSSVVVTAQMNKTAAEHLRADTKFWVVRPQISITRLSGLETLVSGTYIEMDPGPGKAERAFQGLEDPPVVRADVPGTEYALSAEKLGSIGPGSPIFFRGINVGEVTGYQFGGIEQGFTIRIFVRKPYDAYVQDGTRFWNASGINLSAGGAGFKLEVDSLQAVLAGGLAFDTFDVGRQGEIAKDGATFPLFDDRGAAQEASYTTRYRGLIEFDGSVRGLEVGAPVELRGIKVGRVVEIHLTVDAQKRTAKVPVFIELDFDRVGIVNQPPGEAGTYKLARQLTALGLRAQLRSASLITGQLFVALDFFPDAPPAELEMADGYPKIPAVPTELENVTRSVHDALDKLAQLPLEELLKDARKLIGSAQTVVGNPELAESIRGLNNTLASTARLMDEVQPQAGPLLASLRKVSDSADMTAKRADETLASLNASYGQNSRVRSDISELLRQLQDTSRSVKWLASYLEQHPEALLRGKSP